MAHNVEETAVGDLPALTGFLLSFNRRSIRGLFRPTVDASFREIDLPVVEPRGPFNAPGFVANRGVRSAEWDAKELHGCVPEPLRIGD